MLLAAETREEKYVNATQPKPVMTSADWPGEAMSGIFRDISLFSTLSQQS